MTMNWTRSDILEATRGTLLQGSPVGSVGRISTDTRSIEPGDAFVALRGENHDAHDFLGAAVEKGAETLVVSRLPDERPVPAPSHVTVVRVPDTLTALGQLARFHRSRFTVPVAGITGSNGKTSTKEMVSAILGQGRKVLKNRGNFNNLVGVPLTLLSLEPDHEIAVVEMGINVPGEMDRLVHMAVPTAGIVTNVHPAHLEGLGSLDRILEEKGKLLSSLGAGGVAVINLDDERLETFSKRLECRRVTYSLQKQEAMVALGGPVEVKEGVSVFPLRLGKETVPARLSVLGMHQVQNAVAAAALAWALGESPESVVRGLSLHQPVKQRMQMHRLAGERILIDDTYNANPQSMLASVRTVVAASSGRPVLAVLGEMRELGPGSAALHYEVGFQVGASGIRFLITMGEFGREIQRGARDAGLSASSCFHAGSHEEAVERLRDWMPRDAWIVVKGSRGMTMERVVEGMMDS